MSGDELDIDALLTPPRWDPTKCTTSQALAELTEHEKYGKVVAACDDERVPAANIFRVLQSLLGESPRPETIRRHQTRRGDSRANTCGCP